MAVIEEGFHVPVICLMISSSFFISASLASCISLSFFITASLPPVPPVPAPVPLLVGNAAEMGVRVGVAVLGLLSITGFGISWTLLVDVAPLGLSRTILMVFWGGRALAITGLATAGPPDPAPPMPVNRVPFPAFMAANCSGVTRMTRGSFRAGTFSVLVLMV